MPTVTLVSLIGIALYQLVKFLRDRIERFDSFMKKIFGRYQIDFFNVVAYAIVVGITLCWCSFLISWIKPVFN